MDMILPKQTAAKLPTKSNLVISGNVYNRTWLPRDGDIYRDAAAPYHALCAFEEQHACPSQHSTIYHNTNLATMPTTRKHARHGTLTTTTWRRIRSPNGPWHHGPAVSGSTTPPAGARGSTTSPYLPRHREVQVTDITRGSDACGNSNPTANFHMSSSTPSTPSQPGWRSMYAPS